MRRLTTLAALLGPLLVSATASAGFTADENAKAGWGNWPVTRAGTAFGAGRVDVYPAEWSIVPGESLHLKVRSTSSYNVRILRLGWYGGKRSRQIAYSTGRPSDAQPYPSADSKYGLTEARWHTNVTFGSTSSWPPGFYVARVERSDGYQAETPFVVRDDNGPRLPVLLVLSTTTHQAYNAWPGPGRGGKSLYAFNSSSTHPTDSVSGVTQAVKVSFDRPYYVGGGTADLGNFEYPMAAFLEQRGWDVAYANDQDLHTHPGLLLGRRAVIFVGHSEYWTRNMFDAALAARDRGVNFLFATGDTLSWQVRLEPGSGGSYSTLVGYKESWVKDPEQKTAYSLEQQGSYSQAAAHYRYVTRGWKSLAYHPEHGIDERRPGMIMTGVMSSGIIRDSSGKPTWFPWADLRITNSTHWIYKGLGVSYGTRIHDVMGYEVDSTQASRDYWDPWRPSNQVRIGTINQVDDNKIKGSAAVYRKSNSNGTTSEVVALGAIAFSWALDDFAQSGTESSIAKGMVNNALQRWLGFSPAADGDMGHDEDPTPDPSLNPNEGDDVYSTDEGAEVQGNGVACNAGSSSASDATVVGFTLGALGLAVIVRRRRRGLC